MHEQHEESFRACTWHVDRTERLTGAGVFDFFQEVAGNHARLLGVGTESFREEHLAWILSRMSVEVLRRPRWGEELRARTWPRGTQRLFAIRDYELLDSQGERVAVGRSGWIILDTQAMRPRRPESFVTGFPANEGRDALPDGARGLRSEEGLPVLGRRIAAYSDIDYNGHVNNARYIQWMQDVLPIADLEATEAFRLDIDYVLEVKAGEELVLKGAPRTADGAKDGGAASEGPAEGNVWSIEGVKVEDGKTSFRAEFRPRSYR